MHRHGERDGALLSEASPASAPDEPEGPDPLLGAVLAGRYTVVRALGRGGMGAVYEARSPQFGSCAVKTIRADASLASKDAVRRFLREARSSLAIQSEHVVTVHEVDVDADNRPFLAMELLEGRDLSAQIKGHGALEPGVAAALFAQACRGLAAAHALGIVHRDVKPANLFLHQAADGTVSIKVCDFGIAKRLGDAKTGDVSTDLTHTGGLVGSPAYMSPEQAQNARTTDHRTDVWSLAVALHEALTGARLWSDTQNLGALLVTICTRDAPSLLGRAPWVPEGLVAVVHRGLQRDPGLRFASMAEFEAALLPLATSEKITWAALRPIGQTARVDDSTPPAAAATDEATGGPTLTSSRPAAPGPTAGALASPAADAPFTPGSSASLGGATAPARSHPSDEPPRPSTGSRAGRLLVPAGISAALLLAGAAALRSRATPDTPASMAAASVDSSALAMLPTPAGSAVASALPLSSAGRAAAPAAVSAPPSPVTSAQPSPPAARPGAARQKATGVAAETAAPPTAAALPAAPPTAAATAKKPTSKEEWQ
jgi:eukaryotic-like serine/threonine-protein kinase